MSGEFWQCPAGARMPGEEKASEESSKNIAAENWARKECFKMYGEYLENLRRPYPEYPVKWRPSAPAGQPVREIK